MLRCGMPLAPRILSRACFGARNCYGVVVRARPSPRSLSPGSGKWALFAWHGSAMRGILLPRRRSPRMRFAWPRINSVRSRPLNATTPCGRYLYLVQRRTHPIILHVKRPPNYRLRITKTFTSSVHCIRGKHDVPGGWPSI